MKTIGAFIAGLIFGAAVLAHAQTPALPLPKRDAVTVDAVFEELGRCNVSLVAEQKYTQQLIARIRELETKKP